MITIDDFIPRNRNHRFNNQINGYIVGYNVGIRVERSQYTFTGGNHQANWTVKIINPAGHRFDCTRYNCACMDQKHAKIHLIII